MKSPMEKNKIEIKKKKRLVIRMKLLISIQ